ncbi:SEC-C motif-containing protein [Chromohalobacter marismortui]|uniref:SEC-C motif-containing protein n=1 Tax=Chromohalobacter marismortui TaxID=42055 RepID=A0A4R7NPM5_9GAMM|nr:MULTISPECIES: YchJ family metal-binding protein [Chromohalobacter]MCI0508947.1 SEC-C domain-containing protein [Chromohalobacter sp.]MCI0592919.1 SEC-C domain-containing protein [Chromohalobacter sp.]TDU22678.1 SEC-C motif-containing protein [Chromohalobacter marismortui]
MTMNKKALDTCPCGQPERFEKCCAPIHGDPRRAKTPEALMRARYSAFAREAYGVLIATWDPVTCPPREALATSGARWLKLTVHDSTQRGENGTVTFSADFIDTHGFQRLTETSRFRFSPQAGQWLYVDGDAQWHRLDIGRNAACPCGSGLKVKRCCARG